MEAEEVLRQIDRALRLYGYNKEALKLLITYGKEQGNQGLEEADYIAIDHCVGSELLANTGHCNCTAHSIGAGIQNLKRPINTGGGQ